MNPTRRSSRRLTETRTQASESAVRGDTFLLPELEERNPYEDEGEKCEIQTWERRFNSRGEETYLQSGTRSEFWEQESTVESALVLTSIMMSTENLHIQSYPFIRPTSKPH
jgi:hypothetical protein